MVSANRISFDQVVSRLPSLARPPEPVGDHPAFEVSPDTIDNFVSPTFETLNWPHSAGVLLIEAPGAVGKTVTAEALAARLGWPLVRAEKAQVGSYSLSGLINDALGFDDYLSRVRDARAGIIVDSLDEAHLKAGTQNFLAFIQNIVNICGKRTDPSQASIILMSRTDTGELIQAAFDDVNVPLAHVRLAFFDYQSAVEFIRGHLTSRFNVTRQPEYNVARASPRPFLGLVDERFKQLTQILLGERPAQARDSWAACEEFLGYAPVLTVLAESAACTNPAKELADLKRANLASNEQLLLDICTRILRREQDKFSKNFYAKLKASLPANDSHDITAESLYTPQEQLLRVFSSATDAVIVAPPPADLPEGLRPIYEEAVQQFVADHPYLRGKYAFSSVVFKDFVSASLANDLSAQASLEKHPSYSIRDVGVGPFLCGFLEHLTGGNSPSRVPESLVHPLIASWRQWFELTGVHDGQITVYLTESQGFLAASYVDNGHLNEDQVRQSEIYDMSGAFALPHVPRDFVLVTDQGVILGERNRALSVAAGSLISADEIDIQSDALSLQGTHSASSAVFAANKVRADYLRSYSASREKLQIHAETVPQLLHPLQAQLMAGMGSIPFSDYVDLRAILLSFRRTVHKGISAPKAYVERVVRGNRHRELLLRSLVQSELIELNDDWYILKPENLALVGFSLHDIKNGEPTQAVLEYLGKCRYQAS